VAAPRIAVVGCGVIGAGWAARLRLRGVDVRAYDPAPVAERVLAEVYDNALRAWRLLDLEPPPESIGALTIFSLGRTFLSLASLVRKRR